MQKYQQNLRKEVWYTARQYNNNNKQVRGIQCQSKCKTLQWICLASREYCPGHPWMEERWVRSTWPIRAGWWHPSTPMSSMFRVQSTSKAVPSTTNITLPSVLSIGSSTPSLLFSPPSKTNRPSSSSLKHSSPSPLTPLSILRCWPESIYNRLDWILSVRINS